MKPNEAQEAAVKADGEAPYYFEGTCVGCGRTSSALNRRTLCRSCTEKPERHTYPVEPE
ncbi:hypothetical protein GCM10008956_40010 [Deinococcus arenae]|uniref:Uncharacterized protein n=1 Tax=Deinococcus arenae TaxID=1452751 RepID=A0A8H9GXN9_9DEIO|nr:hypothetical protein GCM10008956_40010 [Deinococcus arenae]